MELNYNKSPVNIGTKETVSIKDLVYLISTLSNHHPKINFNINKPEDRLIKSSDTKLLYNILPKFKYNVSLKEGLQRMLYWYNEVFKIKLTKFK